MGEAEGDVGGVEVVICLVEKSLYLDLGEWYFCTLEKRG